MSDQLKEVLDRVIRLESRMVQLGDHVGANLRSKQRIDIYMGADPRVVIDSLDVSMSRVLTELRKSQFKGQSIEVWCNNQCVCDLFINSESKQ